MDNPLPARPGDYAHIAAVGVLSPSHAAAAMIDQVVTRLPTGCCFVFSLNDHTLADPAYNARILAQTDAGSAELAFRQYGNHMEKRGIKADVCILRKT